MSRSASDEGADCYTSQGRKLAEQMEQFLAKARRPLAERYGEEGAATVSRETLAEFERLLPSLPYIGGKENPLSRELIRSAGALALYRTLQQRGGTVEEAGEIIHYGLEAMLYSIPSLLRRGMGWLQFTGWQLGKMREAAGRSQGREYDSDWVYELIEGDGETYDWGVDFYECGIVKYLQAQGAEELTAYLCNTDYRAAGAMGTGLQRTMTLAWGCEKCDFRYKQGRPTPKAWPPQFVERHCGQPRA
jgi:hypothetical protein